MTLRLLNIVIERYHEDAIVDAGIQASDDTAVIDGADDDGIDLRPELIEGLGLLLDIVAL